MKRVFLTGLLSACAVLAFGQLIISQYVETNSGLVPKGIELWNVSGGTIDFSVTGLNILQGTNGGAPVTVFVLSSGTLAAGEVLVVGTSDMSGTVIGGGTCGSFQEEPFQFNGDDALVIQLNGTTVDVFGTPGVDPGNSWDGGGVSTANSNIQLKMGITSGDTDGWTDPSVRFETVDVGTTLTGFGTPPGGCVGPSCGVSNFMVAAADCNSINEGDGDTYNVEISYSGTDALAFINYSGSGSVVTGDAPGDLQGPNIEIINIPETEDVSFIVSGGTCNEPFDAPAPACDPVPIILINEIDADQVGTDSMEFVELAGPANASLDGFVLVLFNGSGDVSYFALDLDGETLDENGFFVVGSTYMPEADVMSWATNGIQNGADGVGLYFGVDGTDFPNGTPVTDFTTFLVDGAVYGTNDANDTGLLAVLDTEQSDEDEFGMSTTQSVQRNGTPPPKWIIAEPTPGAPNASIMPVELAYFHVKHKEGKARLSWATAQEIQNDYFSLQHSRDGVHFLEFGQVKGQGTSSAFNEYHYDHNNMVAGKNFYRLKQIDLDGSFSYSPVRVINKASSRTEISLYPTLVTDRIYLSTESEEIPEIRIFNTMGNLVWKEESGDFRSSQNTLNLSGFSQGIYLVEVTLAGTREVFKVYKK